MPAPENVGPKAPSVWNAVAAPPRGGTTHHVLESSQDSCCDDAQEQAQGIHYGRGPEQPVEVEHVLTAAHAHELIVCGRVLGAAHGEGTGASPAPSRRRPCHACDRAGLGGQDTYWDQVNQIPTSSGS